MVVTENMNETKGRPFGETWKKVAECRKKHSVGLFDSPQFPSN